MIFNIIEGVDTYIPDEIADTVRLLIDASWRKGYKDGVSDGYNMGYDEGIEVANMDWP